MIEVADSMIVKFGSGANDSALVKLELDDALNLDSEGKVVTRFGSEANVFIRLHHDYTVQLGRMLATDGQMDAQGIGTRQMETQLLWAEKDDEHELAYIPAGPLSVGYYGNEALEMRKSGPSRKIFIKGGTLPALSLVRYDVNFSLYRLLAPKVELAEDESYPITIVAYMEAAP